MQPTAGLRQIRPAREVSLPQIKLPQNRLLLYALPALGFVLLVIFALGQLKNDAPVLGANAIWLGTGWTYEASTDADLNTLVSRLQDNRIGIVYAWVSLLQPNGAWTETNRLNAVRDFVTRFKAAYPGVSLYGWLSIGSQGVDGNNRLSDASLQQLVADFSQRMTAEFGFDGVFLNVVPVSSGDEGYLSLLRKVRATIGDGELLAVAVPPDWTPEGANIPLPPQIAPGAVWQQDYKQRVALLADQIFVSAYNTGLETPEDYAAWMAYQVRSFTRAIADLDATTELIIGVPTYDAVPPDHDPAVENPASAIQGLRAGLAEAGDAAVVVGGIGIYAEWETSEAEWLQIKNLWVNS